MVYFIWSGEWNEAASSGFQAYGRGCTQAVGGVTFGMVDAMPSDRAAIQNLHDHITVLPGPNGKLTSAHVALIQPAFPDIQAGATLAALFTEIFSATGALAFDPAAL